MRKIALVRIFERRAVWTRDDELIDVGGGFEALDFKEASEDEIQEWSKAVALRNARAGVAGEAYALLVQAEPEEGRLLLAELADWARAERASQEAQAKRLAEAAAKRDAKREKSRLARLGRQLGLAPEEVERLAARAKKSE